MNSTGLTGNGHKKQRIICAPAFYCCHYLPKGRQIMWAWVFDDRPDSLKNYYRWNGIYGLPRSLWINKEGVPGRRPVEELKNLRMNERVKKNIYLTSNTSLGGTGIQFFSKGGNATVTSVKIWDIAPSNPY